MHTQGTEPYIRDVSCSLKFDYLCTSKHVEGTSLPNWITTHHSVYTLCILACHLLEKRDNIYILKSKNSVAEYSYNEGSL